MRFALAVRIIALTSVGCAAFSVCPQPADARLVKSCVANVFSAISDDWRLPPNRVVSMLGRPRDPAVQKLSRFDLYSWTEGDYRSRWNRRLLVGDQDVPQELLGSKSFSKATQAVLHRLVQSSGSERTRQKMIKRGNDPAEHKAADLQVARTMRNLRERGIEISEAEVRARLGLPAAEAESHIEFGHVGIRLKDGRTVSARIASYTPRQLTGEDCWRALSEVLKRDQVDQREVVGFDFFHNHPDSGSLSAADMNFAKRLFDELNRGALKPTDHRIEVNMFAVGHRVIDGQYPVFHAGFR